MLVRTPLGLPVVLVESTSLLPRFWATVWASGFGIQQLKEGTLRARLRHIGVLYAFCDQRYGLGALDLAIGGNRVDAVRAMVGEFYCSLTDEGGRRSASAQWQAVRYFLHTLGTHLSAYDEAWIGLPKFLDSFGRIRHPSTGKLRFVRALPDATLSELVQVAHPQSARNPFRDERVRRRNWLILHLLLLCGLRRGELLLLVVDSLKHGVNSRTGEVAYWLDVTTVEEEDGRASRPSIKTRASHRQVPVSPELAAIYEHYVEEARVQSDEAAFLFTSARRRALSAESVTKIFEKLTIALSKLAFDQFRERTGGKRHLSPHDMRHTCATARYALFMASEPNRELTLQRMRAFFGWSATSDMPELYARSAIQDDLVRSWCDTFDQRLVNLRRRSP